MDEPDPDPSEVSLLLQRWGEGEAAALDELLPLVYGELRSLAAAYLRRERQGHTLQPTAVVHEAFLRLVGQREVSWQSRGHFFALAAQAMRRVLVDHARRRRAGKRVVVAEPASPAAALPPAADVLDLDAALERLATLDQRQAQIVELRTFGGLTVEEVSGVLDVSTATVEREWRAARAWLRRELERAPGAD